MESCCRACSRSDEFRRFSLYAVAEVSQEVIANMIRDTSDTQVSTEDGLPQQICPDCLMTLSLAYTFRKQCRRSDAKFREYWGGRTPSQSIDQQQQQQQHQHPHPHPQQPSQPHQLPRRSQSQVPDESSFEVATAIKEEVDIYDYEYSVSSAHDEQLLIQNPRTIGEGAMTVVHTGGQYYDDGAGASETSGTGDRDGHGMMQHPMDDSYEMGECSGLGQKKLKNKAPSPERFSQRIRRQMPDSSKTTPTPRAKIKQYMSWTNQQMTNALEDVKDGMSIMKAAATYNIPFATLYTNAKRRGIKSLRARGGKGHRGRKQTDQQMTDALEAVKTDGMTIWRAATTFNIPFATLYRNAKRHGIRSRVQARADERSASEAQVKTEPGTAGGTPDKLSATGKKYRSRLPINWTNQQMADALEAVKGGLSIMKAATTFSIPFATLYNNAKRRGIKSRLQARGGRGCTTVRIKTEPGTEGTSQKLYKIPVSSKKYKSKQAVNWTNEDMDTALEAVQGGMSIMKAASTFNIPFATLYSNATRRGIRSQKAFIGSYSEEHMNSALEAIQGGMNWKAAATMFMVPRVALLHRGRRCGLIGPKPNDNDSYQEQMNKALQAIQDGMSFRRAEEVFNIARGKICQRAKLSGIFPSTDNPDAEDQELTAEEQVLTAVEQVLTVEEQVLTAEETVADTLIYAKPKNQVQNREATD